jgi:hypothetical protein
VDDALKAQAQVSRDRRERVLGTVANALARTGVIESAMHAISVQPDVSPERARALTLDRPVEFAKRWMRWYSGDAPRGPDDPLIWDALSSIPSDGGDPIGLRGDALLKQALRETESVPHYVVLIHGIRTTAGWQEMMRDELSTLSGVVVKRLGYGWLDVVRFWLPWTRRRPINLLRSRIIDVIKVARADHPGAALSVVAHSFGTYALAEVLRSNELIVFHRVVLCGSVLPVEFEWERFEHQVTGGIVNDVGVRDLWPVLAQATSWGYGASGTFGFKHGRVEDRNHDVDHGGFFTREFVRQYWLPWLENGELRRNPAGSELAPRYRLALLSLLPLRWLLAATLLGGISLGVWRLVAP